MGIRQFRPMTPATRFRSVSDFSEITKTEPEKSLLEPLRADRRAQQQGPHHERGTWAAGTSGSTGASTSSATSSAIPAQRRGDRVRPEPHRAHRAAALRGRREALHPRAQGPERGRHRRLGPGLGHPHRQRDAAVRDPARHRGAQHRAQDRQGRPAVPLGAGTERAGGGEGRQLRHAAPAARPRCAWCAGECLATIGEVGQRRARAAVRSARRARRAGSGAGRGCAASR